MAEPGLRERKKQKIRRRILDVCARLFRSRGYDETTIDDVISEAEISRQTFFNYFRGKDAVLAELGLEWLQSQTELPRRGLEAEGAPLRVFDGIREALRGQLQAIEKDRDFMRVVFTRSGLLFPTGPHVGSDADETRLDRTRQLLSALAALIRSGQEAGRIRDDVPAEQAAELYVAVLVITIRLWLTDYWPGASEPLVERGMRALDVLEAGLQPDAPRRTETP